MRAILLFLCFLLKCLCDEEQLCDSPPSVEHATISESEEKDFPVGSTITYNCEFGYIAEGSRGLSMCIISEDGIPAWTRPEIICLPRSCGDPGFVINAHRIGLQFTFPNSITFECNEGYILHGTKQRFCQASGQWSGILPRCERIYCPPPEKVENGHVIASSLEFGSELKYECDKGYLLRNYSQRFCLGIGMWSGHSPKCIEESCQVPNEPKYGTMELIGNQPKIGSIILYACNPPRKLVGSPTSKCLKTGVWTFPPPECLEPCKVPEISHGEIGRYSFYSRSRKIYTKLSVGVKVDEDKEYVLKCENKFEPLGQNKAEVKVSCLNGKWSEQPVCKPASCYSLPPKTNNAKIKTVSSNHQGVVVYACNSGFRKTKTGNVTCIFGTWHGITPVCQDTRCYVKQIEFTGLTKPGKNIYADGESFIPLCKDGYKLAQKENKIHCVLGIWEGHFPPCIAAGCQEDPPPIEYGFVKSYFNLHSSIVNYECNYPYILENRGNVQCLFGKWEGQLPICKDSRCYLKDLKRINDINVAQSSNLTEDGSYLKVICSKGYMLKHQPPKCSQGKWIEKNSSPCQEKDCKVIAVNKGHITRLEEKGSEWRWSSFKFVKTFEYRKIRLGTKFPHSAQIYLSCNDGYVIRGQEGLQHLPITCDKGAWMPFPVCLRPGEIYREEIMPLSTNTEKSELSDSKNPRISFNASSIDAVESTKYPFQLEHKMTTEVEDTHSNSKEVCSCLYGILDQTLIAYAGDEQLVFGSLVEDGCVIKFHCKDFGYSRLVGPRELTCTDCHDWHSSEFPSCIEPSAGDAFLLFEKTPRILPGGILNIQKGASLRVRCITLGTNYYPTWEMPDHSNTQVEYTNEYRNSIYVLSAYLDLIDARIANDGEYICKSRGYKAANITLRIEDPDRKCPPLESNSDLLITYQNQRRINSIAIISCSKLGQRIVGSTIRKCLENGEWSNKLPTCKSNINITCSEILQEGNLRISYTYQRRVGSKAAFHCVSPSKREGPAFAICQENGTWSEPLATCKLITCPELPQNEDLNISYTYERHVGSKAIFHCFLPTKREGMSYATCLENGKWSAPLPSCKRPDCSIDVLFSQLPLGIVPILSNVSSEMLPYGSKLKLECEGNSMQLIGSNDVTCSGDGQWEIKRIECVPGCGRVSASETIIVHPLKDFYRFGEMAILSCPPGLKLSSNVERLVCLNYGWSEKAPGCIEI